MPPLPARPAARTALFGVPRQGRRWPGAARVAAAVAIPGLIGVLAGAGPVAGLASLGAFAVVYGEGRPYRTRWRVVGVVGAVIVVLSLIGACSGAVAYGAVADGGSRMWPMVVVAAMTVTVAVCAFVVDALRLGAPGAFLLLLTVEIASSMPLLGVGVGTVVLWTAIGVAAALPIAMSGVLVRPRTPERAVVAAALAAVDAVVADSTPARRRDAVHALHVAWQRMHDAGLVDVAHPLTLALRDAHLRCASVLHALPHDGAAPEDDLRPQIPLRRPSVRYRLMRAAHPRGRSMTIVVRLLVAGAASGALAIALGVPRPDWAVITAAMILHQGPDRILGSFRAVHRFAGTLIGLALLAGTYAAVDLHGVVLVVVLALTMAGTEVFLVRNYGVAMVFITPFVMVLGGLGEPVHPAATLRDRLVETVVGVAVAVAVLWVVLPRAHRRHLEDADARVAETMGRIAAAAHSPALPELRRDLEFDLHASTTAALVAAHTEPEWTAPRWPLHRDLHERGYRLLTLPGRAVV